MVGHTYFSIKEDLNLCTEASVCSRPVSVADIATLFTATTIDLALGFTKILADVNHTERLKQGLTQGHAQCLTR